jgi:tRNA-dihydrouridine synthase B
MYSGSADWSAIRQLKNVIKIPYLCNGDIKSTKDAAEALNLSHAHGIMIGRAALGRPWLLKQVINFLRNESIIPTPSAEEQFKMIMQHFYNTLDFYGKNHGIKVFRKHFCWYSVGLSGSSKFRETINKAEDTLFIKNYVEEFYRNIVLPI